jgi:hypothetical protein
LAVSVRKQSFVGAVVAGALGGERAQAELFLLIEMNFEICGGLLHFSLVIPGLYGMGVDAGLAKSFEREFHGGIFGDWITTVNCNLVDGFEPCPEMGKFVFGVPGLFQEITIGLQVGTR